MSAMQEGAGDEEEEVSEEMSLDGESSSNGDENDEDDEGDDDEEEEEDEMDDRVRVVSEYKDLDLDFRPGFGFGLERQAHCNHKAVVIKLLQREFQWSSVGLNQYYFQN